MVKDYPEMHTAEHILNQTMVRLFGTDRCFSAHINEKKSKCDYKFDRELSNEDKEKLSAAVNDIISSDLLVSEEIISPAEADKKYNLSRLPDGQNKEIRIIKIGDYDACPCIGQHARSTKELGIFRLVSTKWENGVLRIIYKLQ